MNKAAWFSSTPEPLLGMRREALVVRDAICLLSGGQDSTTCLFWARNRFAKVTALSFDYGQRHITEILAAKKVAEMAGVEHQILTLGLPVELHTGALLDHSRELGGSDTVNPSLPSTFIPGRNLLFLTVAAAWCYPRAVRDIVIGVSGIDYSGYPDCRPRFIAKAVKSLGLALDSHFTVHTPVIFCTKAETVKLADGEPGCLAALAYTQTCYTGEFPPCEVCPACTLRAKGFREAGISDPLMQRVACKEVEGGSG